MINSNILALIQAAAKKKARLKAAQLTLTKKTSCYVAS